MNICYQNACYKKTTGIVFSSYDLTEFIYHKETWMCSKLHFLDVLFKIDKRPYTKKFSGRLT